ncbi:hypothetical protein Desku_1572 [Desulfofundulus kuznetsovii DSM 6115]|uniref:Uncharacterized protein n=1 Tax=Desulfofundulus kuznetsovii (strain DSM 6115 / VKM B-1805 / 17) TaxID=760568 RepID=A0AAU8PAQ7_DESK7|nr:hypothetical protein Desku_1572 [Desulfofundulus kuznetsovii DSM 6115]
MGLTRHEQETIIIWNEGEAQAEIYTASPLVAARLKKLGLTPYRKEGPGLYFKVLRGAVRLKVGNRTVRIAGGKTEERQGIEKHTERADGAPEAVPKQPAGEKCPCGREFVPENKRQIYCDLCAGQRKAERSKAGMAKIRRDTKQVTVNS